MVYTVSTRPKAQGKKEGIALEAYCALAGVYDALMRDVDYDAWAGYLSSLLADRGKLEGRIAEAACGTGQLSIRMAKRGYRVTPGDLSQEMLLCAQENARKAGVFLLFVEQDMRKLELPPQEAIFAACDAVNYLTREETKAFFAAAHGCLKPGGWLLFDVSSEYKLKEVLGDNLFCDDTEDLTCLWKSTYDETRRAARLDVTVFERRGEAYFRRDESQEQFAHSKGELTRSLVDCGFESVDCFGFLTKAAPEPRAQRLQFLARRPE